MKLIDILCKIAKKEEIPTFRFKDPRYKYFMKNNFLYQQKFKEEPRPVEWEIYSEWLAQEVEILESEEDLDENN